MAGLIRAWMRDIVYMGCSFCFLSCCTGFYPGKREPATLFRGRLVLFRTVVSPVGEGQGGGSKPTSAASLNTHAKHTKKPKYTNQPSDTKEMPSTPPQPSSGPHAKCSRILRGNPPAAGFALRGRGQFGANFKHSYPHLPPETPPIYIHLSAQGVCIAIHRKFQTRRVAEDSTHLYGEATQHRMRLSVDGYKSSTTRRNP